MEGRYKALDTIYLALKKLETSVIQINEKNDTIFILKKDLLKEQYRSECLKELVIAKNKYITTLKKYLKDNDILVFPDNIGKG